MKAKVHRRQPHAQDVRQDGLQRRGCDAKNPPHFAKGSVITWLVDFDGAAALPRPM